MQNKNNTKGVFHLANSQKHYCLQRAKPDTRLAPFIEQYWLVEWDLRNKEPHTQRNLPDPSVNITFENDSPYLYGAIKKTFTHTLSDQGRIFGIKFNPGGFYPLSKKNQSQLCDKSGRLTHYLNRTDIELLMSINSNNTIEQNSQITNRYFNDNLFNPDSSLFIADIEHQIEQLNLINQIITSIKSNHQITKVNKLSLEFEITQRNLQRLFNRYIGLSPKWVIRKFRMQEILARLDNHQKNKLDWQTIISDLGYTDQAHFIHDFKLFTGYKPQQYAQKL